MTIKTYAPENLDKMALRFLDLASCMRNIAKIAREEKCLDIPIHDRKALQWCENLELWAKKSEINLKISIEERKKSKME